MMPSPKAAGQHCSAINSTPSLAAPVWSRRGCTRALTTSDESPRFHATSMMPSPRHCIYGSRAAET